MGRPSRHVEASILESAKQLSAEVGPHKLTIAAVAARTGAPVGSIYHRYASRDEILATVWLELVEAFQEQFLAALAGDDPVAAGLAAVRFTCDWVRRHPREARLMLVHRREDFAAERWSKSHRRRAQVLTAQAHESLRRYASRLRGRSGPAQLRSVRFALVDLPTAALKPDLESGIPLPKQTEALLLDTCAYALRQITGGRRRVKSGRV
ncbi:MAG: TetR/AcrR family transcriptional regulator [Deltaproteobacteria bacterium]|nr:TetR/AcrR family transcriptional regulator [Deltaproteobacteria bacterium]